MSNLAADAQANSRPPRVSLTMIVRDEEHNLPDCLRGVAGLFDEIVVVDTGSTDRTRDIAVDLGANVHDFGWVDDFAAARNASLDRATGVWVFWLDADDRLDGDNRGKLAALLESLGDDPLAFAFPYRCSLSDAGGTTTVADYIRLFRRDLRIRWSGRVHEQLLPALRAAGHEVRLTEIAVDHLGYADPQVRQRKLERNLRLLRLDTADRPDDPFTLFNLGATTRHLGRIAEAIPLLQRALARSGHSGQVARKSYVLLADCHGQMGWADRALAVCLEGLTHHSADPELLFVAALARQALGDLTGAEACLRRILTGLPRPRLTSMDGGVEGTLARHNLAAILFAQGRVAEAEAEWRALLERAPDFIQAWRGLGELCIRQGYTAEAAAIADRLTTLGAPQSKAVACPPAPGPR